MVTIGDAATLRNAAQRDGRGCRSSRADRVNLLNHGHSSFTFPAKDADNGRRLVTAVRHLGFMIDDTVEREIIAGKDFIQLTDGPFDIEIVFAPDGIENYAEAKRRAVTEGIFPVANIRDIIASKKASNRMKDRLDLHLLDLFRIEYELRR